MDERMDFSKFTIPEPTEEELKLLAKYCEPDVLREGDQVRAFRNADTGDWSVWIKGKDGRIRGMGQFSGELKRG